MGNRIVHFEIPAGDVEKLSKFYSDLFDWKFSKQTMPDPTGGMDYWMIQTTGMGPEHLAGGMYRKQEETDKPRFFVYVEDIDSHTEKLKQAGGTVIYGKQELPGMGWSVPGCRPRRKLAGTVPGKHATGTKEKSFKEKGKAKEKEQKEVNTTLTGS